VNGVLTPTTENLCKGTYHLIFRGVVFPPIRVKNLFSREARSRFFYMKNQYFIYFTKNSCWKLH